MRKIKPFSKEWEALITSHVPYVRKICFHHTKDWDQAKDLAQDVLLVVLGQEDKFTHGSYIKAWLRRICHNEFINHCRKANRIPYFETLSDSLYESKVIKKANHNEGEYALLKKTVDNAIEKLRIDKQQIMNLLIAGYKYDQIADETGVNISAVRSKIFRARAKMENLIPSLNPNQAKRETVKSV